MNRYPLNIKNKQWVVIENGTASDGQSSGPAMPLPPPFSELHGFQ
jgi:hypothetical protein